jgi:NADPH:quinone reductase-like Zn-dependent oxidoreductase
MLLTPPVVEERKFMADPKTSRAFVMESLGYDGLVLRERQVQPPGPSQVLVRMRAASLNYRDLKILKGVYGKQPKLPIIPLSDGAGEIVELGSEVRRFKVGDRVLATYMEGWHAGPVTPEREGWKQKAGDVDGTATEYAAYDQEDVLPIPASISYEEAACLPCAGVTAWHGLVYVGHVKPGDTVLVMGSGGVSVAGLQIARMAGARVIALSSSDDKLERLCAVGAFEGINYKKTPAWGRAVAELAGGRGVDHVLEVGGEETIEQSIAATKDSGHIASIGNLTGKFAAQGTFERGVHITQIVVGSREMTEDLMRAIDLHRELPVVDSRFPFRKLEEAMRHLEAGRHFGKVVITF